VGTVYDLCLRELMDSILCWRLFGSIEIDDTLLQLGLALRLVETYNRNRGRQENEEQDAPPNRVELFVPHPKAAEVYYSICGLIDQHNRSRQDTLM
jgi:hypothetical protein